MIQMSNIWVSESCRIISHNWSSICQQSSHVLNSESFNLTLLAIVSTRLRRLQTAYSGILGKLCEKVGFLAEPYSIRAVILEQFTLYIFCLEALDKEPDFYFTTVQFPRKYDFYITISQRDKNR